MKKNNVSFPYPVLSTKDDILPSLEDDNAIINVKLENDVNYRFTVQLKQNDETITRLINEGKAEYMVEIDCPRTLFNKKFVFAYPSFTFTIARNKLLEIVNFYPVVIAKEDIDEYYNPNFNPDYEDEKFKLRRGDILVSFDQSQYNASIEYNRLMAFDSFMQIRRSESANIVSYDLECPKINVVLPSVMYDQFLIFGQDERYEEVIHASIVLNALLYALQVTDWAEEEENEDRELWKETILYRYKHEENLQKYQLTNPLDLPFIAQELLKDPLKRMFNKLESSENVGFENE